MNPSLPWHQQLYKLERLLLWPAWVGIVVVFLILAWNPSLPSEALALLVGLSIIGVLVVCTFFLVWFYRHWAVTWPGVLLIWAFVAAVNAWPLVDVAAIDSGIYGFMLAFGVILLWSTLALRMILRDGGLALVIGTLIVFTWSAVIAGSAVGGPANLLLIFLTEGDSGHVWAFNALVTGLMCIMPFGPVSFMGWLTFRLYREFLGRGSI